MNASEIHWVIWDRITQRLSIKGLELDADGDRTGITDIKAHIVNDMEREGLITEEESDMLAEHNWCVMCVASQACVCCPMYKLDCTTCSTGIYYKASRSKDLEEALEACRKIRDMKLPAEFDGPLEANAVKLFDSKPEPGTTGTVMLSPSMPLFNLKFVYKRWSDVLDGKDLLYGNTVSELIDHVEHYPYKTEKFRPDTDKRLLTKTHRTEWKLVYYDPLYEFKRAYINGKKVQWRGRHSVTWPKWNDCDTGTAWEEKDGHDDPYEYRIVEDEPAKLIGTVVKDRRLTQMELAMWLAKGNGVCHWGGDIITARHELCMGEENTQVSECYKVRKWDDDEWHEPTMLYCFPDAKDLPRAMLYNYGR